MLDLISSITDPEIEYVSALEQGQDVELHAEALKTVIFSQQGKIKQSQMWYPYEVIESCSHKLEKGHEREFTLCTLLILLNVEQGADTHTDLESKLKSRKADYESLSDEHKEVILSTYARIV